MYDAQIVEGRKHMHCVESKNSSDLTINKSFTLIYPTLMHLYLIYPGLRIVQHWFIHIHVRAHTKFKSTETKVVNQMQIY